MSGNVIRAIGAWNPATLGMAPAPSVSVKTDINATIVGGDEGTIYIENDRVEAFGICARGNRDNNEDGIGVQERDDGSLLFHVADGVGGDDAGERASAAVIEGMAQAIGIKGCTFDEARRLTVQYMTGAGIRGSAGSTYAGLFIDQNTVLPLTTGVIGDSQITAVEKGAAMYTSVSHSEVYEAAHSMDKDALLYHFRLCDREDLLELAGLAASLKPESKSLSVMRLLFEYSGPSRSIIMRSFNIYASHEIGTGALKRRTGNKSLHTIYTDGVSDLFTPLDIAAAFRSTRMPLHEMGLRFAEKLMIAKEKGRKIDVGVRSGLFGIKKNLRVKSNTDNYAYWLIRLKK